MVSQNDRDAVIALAARLDTVPRAPNPSALQTGPKTGCTPLPIAGHSPATPAMPCPREAMADDFGAESKPREISRVYAFAATRCAANRFSLKIIEIVPLGFSARYSTRKTYGNSGFKNGAFATSSARLLTTATAVQHVYTKREKEFGSTCAI